MVLCKVIGKRETSTTPTLRLIRKYVQALMQIAPEHEALADLIALARCYENKGAALRALEAYEQVLRIDSRNQVAKAGRARNAQNNKCGVSTL